MIQEVLDELLASKKSFNSQINFAWKVFLLSEKWPKHT